MDEKNTGGPAFPLKEPLTSDSQGMTLRDYFAAKAITGILAHPKCGSVGKAHAETTNFAAEEAYAVADAMMKAREA